jgi:diguanylate cyclase (GGDEF)-like protein
VKRSDTRASAGAVEQSDTLAAARQAGAVFLLVGVFALGTSLVPGAVGYHSVANLAASAITIATAAASRTRLAQALTGYRSLLLAAFGLLLVATANTLGVVAPIPLGIYFVIVFMWIGQWHPPGTALRFSPLGVIAYLLPFALGAPVTSGAIPSVLLVLPVSVLAGEALARQTTAARRAQSEQAVALQALARANQTDGLTGLGNRRLGNQLVDELAPGDAVAILDLDDFKQVNDEFGHAFGDRLLQDLGEFLRHQIREADTVARMGGEEFLLVIRSAPEQSAGPIVERLLSDWRSTDPLATLSVGVAVHPAGEAPWVTYTNADNALYAAKRAGRDRVVYAAAIAAGK